MYFIILHIYNFAIIPRNIFNIISNNITDSKIIKCIIHTTFNNANIDYTIM